MKHTSAYLDWYIHVPNVKYDFRSSGLGHFKHRLDLGEVDLSVNYAYGNPDTARILAERYNVQPECIFISSEGASGQNARIIRCLAEWNKRKNEAIVEFPTYEPLLRQVQEYFPLEKRLERKARDAYRLDADVLRKLVSNRTGLLVLTNPHAPSGALSGRSELEEIMTVAKEYAFFVLCDEIYAEFDRAKIPNLYSVDPEHGIVTTSFTKAYGLGGLKLGAAVAEEELVNELYVDVLNTVGNSPNLVQIVALELFAHRMDDLERHKRKWKALKNDAERWLKRCGLDFFPNKVGVTYWVKIPIGNSYDWMNEHAIPKFSLAAVPGAFFLFEKGYEIADSNMIRLGLGSLNPDDPNLPDAFEALERALAAFGAE